MLINYGGDVYMLVDPLYSIEFNLTMWNTYTWTCNSSEAWWYLSTVHKDQNDLAVISHDSSCSVCGWGLPTVSQRNTNGMEKNMQKWWYVSMSDDPSPEKKKDHQSDLG